MGTRQALANAPRWGRALWWSVVLGAYFGVLAWGGTWTSTSTLIGVGVLLGAALGPVMVWCEPWERRMTARRLGFIGDVDVLHAVRIDVDAGRVPTDDPIRRELARRYAQWRYNQRILSRVMAVCWGVFTLLLVLASMFGETSPSDLLMLLLFPLMTVWYGYDAGIRMPRCRRALAVLGQDDAAWSSSTPPILGTTKA